MKKLLLTLLTSVIILNAFAFIVPVNPGGSQLRSAANLSTLPLRTQEADDNGITVTYNFSAMSVSPDTLLYKDSYFLEFQGWFNTPNPGEPSLPETHDLFLLPPGATDISVEILENHTFSHPYKPTPGRIWLQDVTSETYTYDNVPPISTESLADVSPVKIEYIGKKRNDVFVAVTVSPIQYGADDDNIQVSNSLSYRLNYTVDTSTPTQQTPAKSNINIGTRIDSLPQIIKPTNPFVEALNNWNKAKSLVNDTTLREHDDYLVICTTHESLPILDFAEWKKTCGHNTTVEYRANWTFETISETILNTFQNNPHLRYIILSGDIKKVPSKVIPNASKPHIDSLATYTDFHYCCLNQQTNNTDTTLGESDRVKDFYLGRFFGNSATEIKTIVDKIVNYEKYGVNDYDFYNSAIHVGFFQDGYPYRRTDKNTGKVFPPTPSTGLDDLRFIMTSEEIRNCVMEHDKSIERQYCMWPYRTDPDYHWQPPAYWRNSINGYGDGNPIEPLPDDLKYPNFWYSHNASFISRSINKGAFYVLELTHGAKDCWENPNYTVDDIKLLTNGKKLPIFFNMGCSVGEFRDNNSFAKVLLTHPNGGGVAAFAFSQDAWCHTAFGTAIGYFNTIWPEPGVQSTLNFRNGSPYYPNIDFSYKKYTPEDRLTLGSIMEGGILQCWKLFGNGPWKNTGNSYAGSNRYEILKHSYMTHLFGDPGMLFPTEAVEAIPDDEVKISYHLSPEYHFIGGISDGSREFILNISLPYEAKIGLYNKTTGKVERYYGKTASIFAPSNKNEYVLSVVKANKLPYLLNIDSNVISAATAAKAPKIESASQKLGDSYVNVTVDFSENPNTTGEVALTDANGNFIGSTQVTPDDNTCAIKVKPTNTNIGIVTLIVDNNVVDATKLNISNN